MNVVLRLSEKLIAPLLGIGGRFLGREHLFVAELGRALEWRDVVIGPEALEARLTVRGARHTPRTSGTRLRRTLRDRRRRCHQHGCGQRYQSERNPSPHGPPPKVKV